MSEKLLVSNKQGENLGSVDVNISDDSFTVEKLRLQLRELTKIPPLSQEIVFGTIKLDDQNRSLKSYGLQNNSNITIKNLGSQVLWKTVFYVEYLGPILVGSLCYFAGNRANYSFLQQVGFLLFVIHYLKREVQTLTIHVFSNDTMPFFNIIKNCLHYWVLCGLFIGVELFHFHSNPGYSNFTIYLLASLFLLFEFLNFMCHLTLSNLRKGKGKDGAISENQRRGIPYGWGFDLVSCANYWWEALSWITFALLVRCWAAYLFAGVSFAQMLVWALKKQRRYKKEFGDKYPRGRKAMVPFII